jgi:predicted nucleic acid-binding protein
MSSSWICVDANVVIRLVTGGEHSERIASLWSEWREDGRAIAAPTLLYYEVSNALRRYVAVGELADAEAREALDAALELGVIVLGDADLHRQALEIAKRFQLKAAYDAHYLALAERLGAEFWTTDARLIRGLVDRPIWTRLV